MNQFVPQTSLWIPPSNQILLPPSNGVDDTPMLTAMQSRGRMNGRGQEYILGSSLIPVDEFLLEDASLVADNPATNFRMIGTNGSHYTKITLAGVTFDRADTGGVTDSAAVWIFDCEKVFIKECEMFGGITGRLLNLLTVPFPTVLDNHFHDVTWVHSAVGIPTSEQIVAVSFDGARKGVCGDNRLENFCGRITWATGQVLLVGMIVINGANKYRITVAGTSGATGPTHTSGAVTIDGVEYTYEQPWATGVAKTAGAIVTNDGKRYKAMSSGTTGATAPTHTGGVIRDGATGVRWRYIGTENRAYQADAMNLTNCDGMLVRNNVFEHVWEAIDLTGSGFNRNCLLQNNVYKNIDAAAEKFGHECWTCRSDGADIDGGGFVGIIIGGGAWEDKSINTVIANPRIANMGLLGTWAGSVTAGIWCNSAAPGQEGGLVIAPKMTSQEKIEVTVTLASPAVFSEVAHGRAVGSPIWLYTERELPTGLLPDTQYWVLTAPSADTYTLSKMPGGPAINSSATAWLTATGYVVGNVRSNGGFLYYALINHTSGTFATDLAAGKWELIQQYAGKSSMLYGIRNESTNTLKVTDPDIKNFSTLDYAITGPVENGGVWETLLHWSENIVAPADTNDNALITFPLAAGKMGQNGILKVTLQVSQTNNANVKTWKVKLGATEFMAFLGTSFTSARLQTQIANKNSYSSQQGNSATSSAFGGLGSGVVTGAINTAAAQNIVISALKATAGDTMTLLDCLIEVLVAGPK